MYTLPSQSFEGLLLWCSLAGDGILVIFALIIDILEIPLENFPRALQRFNRAQNETWIPMILDSLPLPCLRFLRFLQFLSIRAQDCTSIGSHSPRHTCQCLRRNGRMLEGPRTGLGQDGTVWQPSWVNGWMSSWKSFCLCFGFLIVIHHLFLSLFSHLHI